MADSNNELTSCIGSGGSIYKGPEEKPLSEEDKEAQEKALRVAISKLGIIKFGPAISGSGLLDGKSHHSEK